MDPEPSVFLKKIQGFDEHLFSDEQENTQEIKESEAFLFNSPSIVLIGLIIAITSIGVPITVVLTERPSLRSIMVPTASQSNGSKPSVPIATTRVGESGGGNTRWEQE